MCLTIRELELIKNLLKKNKKIQMLSNLVLTTNSLFKYFKSKIEKKNIFYIEADYIWGRKQKLFEWRSLIKKYSLTLGAGIHMIHLIMWLLDSKPQYVQGFINNKITKNTKYKKESFVLAILKFPKDILVKVTANAAGLFKHYHEIKIFGKNQTLSNSLMGSYSFEKKNKTNKFKILKQAYPDKKNRKNLIRNFINSIFVKRQKFDQSLNSQLDLMNICFSIDKSIRVNKMIKVKYK
jgi:predicted dehydrogenase